MKVWTKIIQITCVVVLLGRSIQHLWFDSPIRGVLYSPFCMDWILPVFGFDFDRYINHPQLDAFVTGVERSMGVIFLVLAILFVWIKMLTERRKKLVSLLACIFLFVVAFGYFKDKSFSWGQLLEYSSQMFLPLWFVIRTRREVFLKIIIAITFFAHGLYAIGYYPIPGDFVQMLITAFRCSNDTAVLILKIAGILDFVFAVGIFIKPIEKPLLVYGLIWGFLTAFARIYTNIHIELGLSTIWFWMFEFLVRTPHFIIPLLLLGVFKGAGETTQQTASAT